MGQQLSLLTCPLSVVKITFFTCVFFSAPVFALEVVVINELCCNIAVPSPSFMTYNNYVVFQKIITLFIVPFSYRTALYVVFVLQEQVKCRRKKSVKKVTCDKLYLGLMFRHFTHYLPIIKEEHDLWTNTQPPKG